MQKQEFEERIERTVTDEQYKVIEEVYMWHPSIRNTSGKDEVAELYKSFGMTIFHDMLQIHPMSIPSSLRKMSLLVHSSVRWHSLMRMEMWWRSLISLQKVRMRQR